MVAPDQRGYGRTTGWSGDYDGDWQTFRLLSVVRVSLALVHAIGYDSAEAVVGHDFGSPVAALCALIRPDVFKRVVMMSAPFAGSPEIPAGEGPGPARLDIDRELARLDPPRKHYQRYYATRQADEDMRNCVQGLHDFLRAYFHMKSGDWPGNEPFPLAAWTADELAKMPRYYIMDLDRTMAETVAPAMPTADGIGRCQWLPDDELAVYTEEFGENRLSRRVAMVSLRTGALPAVGASPLRRSPHRSSGRLHRRRPRLGPPSGTRSPRKHAKPTLHRLPIPAPARRGGTLGPTRTQRWGRHGDP